MDKIEEEKCLNCVIEYCKTQKGFAKHIGNRLSGVEVERETNECPDFVSYVPLTNTQKKNIIIGIEHFQVDHFSEKMRNGKVTSKANEYLRELTKVDNEFNEVFKKDAPIPESLRHAFAKLTAMSVHNRFTASYDSYYLSFEYSLKKHLRKVDQYISNLQQLAHGNYDIELCFLIDVYSDFSDIFLFDNQGLRKPDTGIAPMFDDIIDLLETVDKKRVQYIILRFNDVNPKDSKRIIALRSGNIRLQLNRMKIKVYKYTGDDHFCAMVYSVNRKLPYEYKHRFDGENIDVELYMPSDDIPMKERFSFVLQGFVESMQLKQQGRYYATSMLVQMMMYVYGDYCLNLMKQGIPITRDIIQLINIHEKEIIDKRMNEFEKIWEGQKMQND